MGIKLQNVTTVKLIVLLIILGAATKITTGCSSSGWDGCSGPCVQPGEHCANFGYEPYNRCRCVLNVTVSG